MMLGNLNPALLVASIITASVPFLLAATGELLVERTGVLNLGVEGMMIIGAVMGFICAVKTQNPAVGFLAAAAGGAAISLIFALLSQVFQANQVAGGLALTLFGIGLSSLLGDGYSGIKPPLTPDMPFGPLRDLPFFGTAFFSHDFVVYFSIAMVALIWWILTYSRIGLILRAVGENHDAAHALGYKVSRIRLMAILFGGAMAGLGGAYISLVRVPQWTDNMTGGAGWIALALVVFAGWRPWRVVLGAYIFAGLSVLQLNLQAMDVKIPIGFLSMLPYLVTIIVLVIMSSGRGRIAQSAPRCLGINFHAAR